MLEIASQITLCLLIAAFIGFIIGYSAGKWGAKKATKKTETKQTEAKKTNTEKSSKVKKASKKKVEEAIPATTEEEIEIPTKDLIANAVEAMEEMESADEPEVVQAETPSEEEKPELLDAPRADGQDSLTKIKGIGPKVEEKLNEAGIYHFDQIASWTEKNIQWLEKNTAFAHRAKKDLWVQQAKIFV